MGREIRPYDLGLTFCCLSLHCELTLSAEYSLNIYCISYDELSEMEIALYLFKGSLYTGLFIA